MPGSINTRYGPNGVTTETDTGLQANLPPILMPGGMPSLPGMPGGFPGLTDLSAAINSRMAIEQERERQRAQIEADREKRAAQMQALQMRAMQDSMNAAQRERGAARFDGSHGESNYRQQMQQMQLDGMRQEMQGTPMYLTPPGGMLTGGYRRATIGDPGSAFAGYAPRGSMPNNSQIVSNGSPVPTGSIESPDMDEAARRAQTTNSFDYTARTQAGMGGYRGNRVTGIGVR